MEKHPENMILYLVTVTFVFGCRIYSILVLLHLYQLQVLSAYVICLYPTSDEGP